MVDPKTILEYATQRSAAAGEAVTAAQQRVAAAQAELALVNTEANNASGALADLERKAAGIRQKLSTIGTPADGAALLDALEQTIIRIRAQQATIVRVQRRFSVARADAAQAQTDLAAASREMAAAAAALEQATQSDAERQAWADALENPPLSTMPAEASKVLDPGNPVEGVVFKEATDRIQADIPKALRDRAAERRAQAAALIDHAAKNANDAEDAILKERENNVGLAGKAEKLWVLFQRAQVAARDFVNTAEARFDQARSTLDQVRDPSHAPLTTEQRNRINDATLAGDRDAAALAEGILANGLAKDVSDKQALLDEAILKAKADPSDANNDAVDDARKDLTDAEVLFQPANDAWREAETLLAAAFQAVDDMQVALAQAIQAAVSAGNDPETDPDVGDAETNLTTAENNLKSAETLYKTSNNGRLDLWEAAVPDTTWRLLEEYNEAVEMLTVLRNSVPATLRNNLKDTEKTYVAAQFAADQSADVLAQLTAERIQRTARQESARQSADAVLFSALRGDE